MNEWLIHKISSGDLKTSAPQLKSNVFIDHFVAPIIRLIDAFLRRRQGIYEFTFDERCLFRISFCKFDVAHCWPDGTAVNAGTEIGELHLYQQHLALLWLQNNLGSAGEFRRRLSYSLGALAHWTETDLRGSRLPGFFGDAWFGAQQHPAGIERALARWGFTIDQAESRYSFWDELYAELLARSFNPSKRGRSLRRMRIWMSRGELLRRYGTAVCAERSSDQAWRISSGMRGVE